MAHKTDQVIKVGTLDSLASQRHRGVFFLRGLVLLRRSLGSGAHPSRLAVVDTRGLLVGGIETMEFAREIGNRAGVLPFTLVLDRSGRVAATHIGTYSVDALDKTLVPLL